MTMAYWSDVAATVHGLAGSSPPSSIRLEFQVNYTPPAQLSMYGIPYALPAQGLLVNGLPMTLANAGVPLQSGEPPVHAQPDGSLTGSFHLDLPLSLSGTSQLFSLALESDLVGVMRFVPSTVRESMSLSLTGILLPDGTPISSEGYNVSFESGLPPPVTPVPEPTAWAVWCILAAFGATIYRRCSHPAGLR